MVTTGPADLPRATRTEILGFRLGIWTLPRGVQKPPPVSRPALAVALLTLAAAVGAIAAFAVPAIDGAKARSAARDLRDHAAVVARLRARLTAEQAPQRASAPAAARLHAAGDDGAARAALLRAVSTSVDRDARARIAAGALAGPVRGVGCRYEGPLAGPRLQISCLATTARIVAGHPTSARTGHPFLAAGSVTDGRYAWCKANAPPAEGSTGTSVYVQPQAACLR